MRRVYEPFFPVGAAVGPRQIARRSALIASEFSSLTAENAMKPQFLQPREGVFHFDQADGLVDFARSHGMKVRGHCLVWHNQTPSWMFQDGAGPASASVLEERMTQHIQTVVSHFRSRVDAWDVVNEAVEDRGETLYRDTPWFRGLGPGYVAQAFRIAHAADPQARLFYNDYNETELPKRDKIVTLLRQLLDEGVPLHGMGMQGHYGPTWPSVSEVRAAIEAYAALGLEIHITELDVSVYRWNHGPSALRSPEPGMLEAQAQRYAELFALFREYREVVRSVTLWGVTDDESWLNHFPEKDRPNWPLLFDRDGNPKPAHRALCSWET